jgi:hypothetical protein
VAVELTIWSKDGTSVSLVIPFFVEKGKMKIPLGHQQCCPSKCQIFRLRPRLSSWTFFTPRHSSRLFVFFLRRDEDEDEDETNDEDIWTTLAHQK